MSVPPTDDMADESTHVSASSSTETGMHQIFDENPPAVATQLNGGTAAFGDELSQYHDRNQSEGKMYFDSFWPRVSQQIVDDYDNANAVNAWKTLQDLPLARIKKIMRLDDDVKMISQEAPIVFAKAAEIFIAELALRGWLCTEETRRRTLQKSDIATAISRCDQFDFLIDIVPREETKPAPPTFTSGSNGIPQLHHSSEAEKATAEGNSLLEQLQFVVNLPQPPPPASADGGGRVANITGPETMDTSQDVDAKVKPTVVVATPGSAAGRRPSQFQIITNPSMATLSNSGGTAAVSSGGTPMAAATAAQPQIILLQNGSTGESISGVVDGQLPSGATHVISQQIGSSQQQPRYQIISSPVKTFAASHHLTTENTPATPSTQFILTASTPGSTVVSASGDKTEGATNNGGSTNVADSTAVGQKTSSVSLSSSQTLQLPTGQTILLQQSPLPTSTVKQSVVGGQMFLPPGAQIISLPPNVSTVSGLITTTGGSSATTATTSHFSTSELESTPTTVTSSPSPITSLSSTSDVKPSINNR